MLSILSLVSLLCLPLLALSAPLLSEHEYASRFADWMTQHNVAYESSALSNKFLTFKNNHAYIAQHNEEAAAGRHAYTLKLNSYADLTNAEYRALLGYRSSSNSSNHSFRLTSTHSMRAMQRWPTTPTGGACPSVASSSSSTAAPVPPPVVRASSSTGAPRPPPVFRASSSTGAPAPPSNGTTGGIDWRNSGFVGPIEDQAQCGSCWSFASTAVMAGAWAQKTGTLYQFSEQQLIDCADGGRSTCDRGGSMYNSYDYFITDGNFPQTKASYPYSSGGGTSTGNCSYSQSSAQTDVRFTGFRQITAGSESALATASNTVAAIAVAIDASTQAFQFYSSGVLTDSSCGNSDADLNHAVTLVGYGSSGGQDYWIVKNSWGTSWGDNGYVLMRRNYNNMCGIAADASYIVA